MAHLVLLPDPFGFGLQAAIQTLALSVAERNRVFNFPGIGRSVLH